MCCKSKSIEIHTQFGRAAPTYPRFTNLLLCTFYLALSALPLHPSPSADGAGSSCALKYHTALHLTTFIILSFWIFNSSGWTGTDEWHIPASAAAPVWLEPVLAMPASRPARRSAGQVSGQGAALILHKYRGNPLPPICWKQAVLKGKVIYLSRCARGRIIWKRGEKSQEKAAKPNECSLISALYPLPNVNSKSSDIIE